MSDAMEQPRRRLAADEMSKGRRWRRPFLAQETMPVSREPCWASGLDAGSPEAREIVSHALAASRDDRRDPRAPLS